MHVEHAGLTHRTELLLGRERESFSSMVDSLFSLDKGEIEHPPLTAHVLDRALDSDDPHRAHVAAFLIGRCRTGDAVVECALTRRLEDLLHGTTGLEMAPPEVAIEAAMSLALRGNVETGRQALRSLLKANHPLGNQYRVAFYLAQMGDPAGYPALVDTFHHEIPHYRLMALRHAIAFLPYEGQEVDGLTVNVRELLVERLADPDEFVRREVPFYLGELQPVDLAALLQPIAQDDPSPTVRTAARMVLDRNQ